MRSLLREAAGDGPVDEPLPLLERAESERPPPEAISLLELGSGVGEYSRDRAEAEKRTKLKGDSIFNFK